MRTGRWRTYQKALRCARNGIYSVRITPEEEVTMRKAGAEILPVYGNSTDKLATFYGSPRGTRAYRWERIANKAAKGKKPLL